MVESRANDPAREHDEWLASLAERNIEIAPEEAEFMLSGHKFVPLFEEVLEMNAAYNEHAAQRGPEITSEHETLKQRIQTVTALYEENVKKAQDPGTFIEEDLGNKMSGQSRALKQMQTQSIALENQAAGIVLNTTDGFIKIRRLIVAMASADPSFSGSEKPSKKIELNGLATLLSDAEGIISQVVAEEASEEPVLEERKSGTKKEVEKKDGRLFDSWEEVFGTENLEKFKAQDKTFIAMYQKAIKRFALAYPDKFKKCGDLDKKGDFDYLGAIEPILGLTVGELNSTISITDSRTEITSARVIAIIKRWADSEGGYVHHNELIEKAKEIRSRGKDDDTKLLELFKPKEKQNEQAEVIVYEADKEEKELDETETAINFVSGALKEMHRQVSGRYSVNFPLTMLTRRKISLYWKPGGKGDDLENGKTINAEFMEKMEKLRLCIPTGPTTGRTHPSYTEKETIKIFVLKLIDADKFNNKNVSRVMSMIDKGYEEGTERFQEWLHSQNG